MIMSKGRVNPNSTSSNLDKFEGELRRGPWILEEDNLLIQYISCHGEGQWNSLAKCAGLKRTGKSCRLRWLNYLKPDVKRGNLSPQEQLLILELHSKLGNRWSKIAKHLPGRTDNEIKNYWRTRVQKQARQLQVDSNSRKFLEAVRMFWKPRLLEKIEQDSSTSSSPSSSTSTSTSTMDLDPMPFPCPKSSNVAKNSDSNSPGNKTVHQLPQGLEKLTTGEIQWEGPLEDNYYYEGIPSYDMQELDAQGISLFECHVGGTDWIGEDLENGFWNSDELWQFRKPEEVGTGF